MLNEGFDIKDGEPKVMLFLTPPVPETHVEYILWGLEEEGIPFELKAALKMPVNSLAKNAAILSKLNVGIGISGEDQTAVLHHRDLPPEKPLFVVTARHFSMTALRRLGANAARLAKGNRLIFEDTAPKRRTADTIDAKKSIGEPAGDELETLIFNTTKEILMKEKNKENS